MSGISKVIGQFARFGLVGVINTGIDFGLTNILFLLFRPDGNLGLVLISTVACAIAAVNSYLMNSRWTFADRVDEPLAFLRFALVALLGLVVNTTVFLFVTKYLHLLIQLGPVLTINVAKLVAVGVAMSVTFLGYRLGVFRSQRLLAFRAAASLEPADTAPAWGRVGAILLLGLVLRLGFLALAPVVYGDAVSYSWVAWLTAQGELAQVDTFWHSLFDFWQALLVLAGADRYPALVLASLIPGTLLILPIYLLGRRLYGEAVGLLAALVTAVHPRLLEYSVNGYAEMLYLFAATWAVWGLTALYQQPGNRRAALVTGLGLGGYFLVRNEVILLILFWLVFSFWLGRRRSWPLGRGLLIAALVALGLSLGYVGLNQQLWDQYGLFAKGSNLAKEHVETLDMTEAARETYGGTPTTTAPGPLQKLLTLAQRWPRNLMYSLERLPGVLFSPLLLFALLLPVLVARRGSGTGDEWPLLSFSLWPLLFYPLLQLEPRLLFPSLIGVNLFGAAGLMAFGRLLAEYFQSRPRLAARVIPGLAALILLLMLPLGPVLAWYSNANRGFHRDVGHWIARQIRPDVRIAGDGYGYVSASTFWAGRKGEPRRWTATPAELVNWAREQGFGVVILYQEYLRRANPEWLPVLESGLPGLPLLQAFDFPRVGKVLVFGESQALIAAASRSDSDSAGRALP